LNPDDEENEIIEDLVGELLQAMEYNVQISFKGPDGGGDVLAYKDAFWV
jgi:restriction system protein